MKGELTIERRAPRSPPRNNTYSFVYLCRFGPRFPAINRAYDVNVRRFAKQVAAEMKINDIVHEGVYSVVGGPSFETIAEIRMLAALGVDAVGKHKLAAIKGNISR